jgi:hypothetical protein
MKKKVPLIFKFRPVEQGYLGKARRDGEPWVFPMRNFQTFISPHRNRPRPLNEVTLTRIHMRVHYLTLHAPEAVTKRHRKLHLRWQKRLDRKGVSVDYINKYSLHKFL